MVQRNFTNFKNLFKFTNFKTESHGLSNYARYVCLICQQSEHRDVGYTSCIMHERQTKTSLDLNVLFHVQFILSFTFSTPSFHGL